MWVEGHDFEEMLQDAGSSVGTSNNEHSKDSI